MTTIAVSDGMQGEHLPLAEVIAEVEKIERREMKREGKLWRQLVYTSDKAKQESPIAFSRVSNQEQITGLNFFIEEDISCGCCFDFVKTEIDDQEVALFAKLDHLERLCIANSSITDHATEALRGATRLEMLDISRNDITDRGLVGLRHLTNLKELLVSDTKVSDSGIKSLSRLKNLTTIDASNTLVSDDALKTLTNCTQLEKIKLLGTKIIGTEIDQINKFRNLKQIDLQVSLPVISDMSPETLKQLARQEYRTVGVRNLAQLENANLKLLPIYDTLRIGDLSKLEMLSIELLSPPENVDCRNRENLLLLHDLPNLSHASIRCPGSLQFFNLPKLKTLSLTIRSGKSLTSLHQLKGLENLSLSFRDNVGPDWSLQCPPLPNLRSLTIYGGSKLSDESLEVLKLFPRLEKLSIFGGEFSSAGLKFLGNNKHLQSLTLQRVTDSGEPLKVLNELSKLRELRIYDGHIGTFHLSGLTHLESFYVKPDIDSLQLQGLHRIRNLSFDRNHKIRRVSLIEMNGLRCFNLRPSIDKPLEFVHLKGLPQIATLRLASLKANPNVNDQAMENLATFKNLSDLNLENAGVTGKLLGPIKQLPKLRRLILTGTSIESHSRTGTE